MGYNGRMEVFSKKAYLLIVIITCSLAFLLGTIKTIQNTHVRLASPPPYLPPPPPLPPSRKLPPPVSPLDTYKKTAVLEKPLILKGDEQLIIENTQYLAQDNITLRDNATLIIRNSFFEHRGLGKSVSLRAEGNSKVILENSLLTAPCDEMAYWQFSGSASFETNTVRPAANGCFPQQRFEEKASGEINSWSNVSVTLCDASSLNLKNSRNTIIDLCFSPLAIVRESFPITPTSVYAFPGSDDFRVDFKVTLTNVTVQHWGIHTAPKTDIALNDMHNLNVHVIAGKPWEKKSIILSDLRKKLYAQETILFSDAKLRLQNVTVNNWDLTATYNNKIDVQNSEIRNIFAKEEGVVAIENNSIVNNIETTDSSEITVTNATVLNSISSNQLSKITLTNSVFKAASTTDFFHVPSQTIRARDRSTITLTDTPLKGTVIQEHGGRVVVQ